MSILFALLVWGGIGLALVGSAILFMYLMDRSFRRDEARYRRQFYIDVYGKEPPE